ncbi:MAG: hypothetical protein WAX69_19910, partial [Victivallales bacterium]
EGSKTLAEKISSGLGLDTRFYHAGLERSEKTKVEEWFLHSQQGVLVATCAYGIPHELSINNTKLEQLG